MNNIIDIYRRWRDRNAAITTLNRMNDHMLADIGLFRAEIPRVVRGLK